MDRRALIGLAAIIVGVLALVQNLNIFVVTQGLVLALLFVGIGLFCIVYYYWKTKNPAMLIIGLLGLFWGAGLLLNEFDILSDDYKTTYFFLGTGLSFLAIYIYDNRRWWAVIPGGILLVLAAVYVLDVIFYLRGGLHEFLFFFGIGLIFLYLFLVRDESKQLQWAIFPAMGLIVFSLFVLYSSSRGGSFQLIVGLVLISIGLFSILHPRPKFGGQPAGASELEHPSKAPDSRNSK